MARTYKQLEQEKTLEQIAQFSKLVAEWYATSEIEYSQTDIARDNNITVKCLRQLMDEAVIYGRVSKQIANMIRDKAINKQKLKSAQAGGTTISHHNRIVRQREEYLVTGMSKKEVNNIANDIAYKSSKPINFFTSKYNFESDRMIGLVLKRAIVENIASDEVVKLIIKRSLGNNPTENAKETFNNFIKQREEYKSSH